MVVLLAACTSGSSGPRLVDAKSIVQLVRNEAGARMPTESVASVTLVDDGSVACETVEVDPGGVQRRWASTSLVTFTDGAGGTLEATYAELIGSFSANGWSEVTYGGGGTVTLKKPGGDATLTFLAEAEEEGTPASIAITIESGCVATEGTGSEEVALLESAGG
jgi:hypothetical protein